MPVIRALACLAALGAVPALAQDGPAGNWRVEWTGEVDAETPTSVLVSLFQPITHDCAEGWMQGCYFKKIITPGTPWNILLEDQGRTFGAQNLIVDATAGTVTIDHDFGVHGYWGGEEVLAMSDADTMTGDWFSRDDTGPSIWRRLDPQISAIAVTNGQSREHVSEFEPLGQDGFRVVLPWTYAHWRDAQNFPDQRPWFLVTLTGTDLWGHHVAQIPDSKGFEVGEVWHDPATGALRLSVILWPGAEPGDHILMIDDIPVTLRLEVPGFPYPPTNIDIAGLAFSGLAGRNGADVQPLNFSGLSGRNGAALDRLQFTGLAGRNGASPRALEFTGWGSLGPVPPTETLVFTGWGGAFDDPTTDPLQFTGWAGPFANQTTEALVFEGWGGPFDNVVLDQGLAFEGWAGPFDPPSTDPLRFQGFGETRSGN